MAKGKIYQVAAGYSITTRRGLIRSGGLVFENDISPGVIDVILKKDGKPRLIEIQSEEPEKEEPEKEEPEKEEPEKEEPEKEEPEKEEPKKVVKRRKPKKVETIETKPSFAFGRKE